MEYRILEADTPSALSVQVNAATADGWQPSGGVSVVIRISPVYMQAVTRVKPVPIPPKGTTKVKEGK